ncbi:hypothetical protein JTB14_000333 [Gonioctena quinquepunctata]|nr:hypothetical protein JTB14_000333 [Gonioctena quinquepunctata]
MGRKIPGRKHHGIRDPEKQAAARFNIIKDKINAPPANPDEQQVSKSLQRVIELKNKVKSGLFNKKRLKKLKKEEISKEQAPKNKAKPNEVKVDKRVLKFKQNQGETDREFVNRMNRICMNITKEAEFEEKYGVEIQRNEDGEVEEVTKRPKDELELYLKKARKEKEEKGKKGKKKKKTNESNSLRLSKWQKRQRKLKEKTDRKKLQDVDEFKKYKDDVKFGEIVHAPPSLTTPRKVEKQLSAPRPGNKNLLLKSMMDTKSKVTKTLPVTKSKESIQKTANKIIDRKGKRKDLPNALRRQLDKQQKEIIGAYKELKAKKYDKS